MDLELLQSECAKCTLCELHKGRNKPVFSRGVHSDIMICGMCPGPDENKIGLPFVGMAGKLLDKLLLDAFGNTDVYITNLVKCFVQPGIKLDNIWMSSCLPYLIVQIRLIQPKVIIALGKDVANFLLANELQMKDMRGKVFDYFNSKLLVTYHPSYLVRGGGEKHKHFQTVVEDFKSIRGRKGST